MSRSSTMTDNTVPFGATAHQRLCPVCRLQCTCREVCGLRICGRRSAVLLLIGFADWQQTDFLFRDRDVAVTMNSVKILHAVRSAITAIAELLVLQAYTSHNMTFNKQQNNWTTHSHQGWKIATKKTRFSFVFKPENPKSPNFTSLSSFI